MNFQNIKQTLFLQGTTLAERILAAIALWIVGVWLIRLFVKITQSAMGFKQIDATVVKYVVSTMSVVLKMILAIVILGMIGVQTATFAALIAAAGLAIGVAWSGLLANFAAGAFLIIFRPFKVGDSVIAGGVSGTVQELGLFTTIINTSDNVQTMVGNNKIFSENIQNFSSTTFRRVDVQAPLPNTVDPVQVINLLKPHLEKIPHVLTKPEPVVEILQLSRDATTLTVRPYCKNKDYWQVYFDTTKMVRMVLIDAGLTPLWSV